MRDYSVTFESTRAGVDEDTLYELPAHLPHGGGITTGPLVYSSTFSVDAANGIDAINTGEKAWIRAHADLGIRMGVVTSCSAKPYDEMVDELDTSSFPELVGLSEIADMIGATRQRAHSLARSGRFPPPVAELGSGPVFLRESVESFIEGWDRKPGRPKKGR